MIEHRQEVIFLLDEYIKTQREWIHQAWIPDLDKWNSDRQRLYWDGIVFGKFRERDPLTMQTLEKGVSDTALQEELCTYFSRKIKEIKDSTEPDILQRYMLPTLQNKYSQLSLIQIDDWINKNMGRMLNEAKEISYAKARVLIYLYHAYYNYDSIRKNPYNSDLSRLTEIYGGIFDKQSQFKSYGLVPIDHHRVLLPVEPPRIYDCSLNKTFFTKNIPLHLLEELSDMKDKGVICNLAVRLLNEPGYDGKMYCEYLQEALERGEQFDLANLGSYSVSKLYSTRYENCLWVVIDPGNITFEELCEDFETVEDMIVTQVVHLEYETSGDGAFITHLDHEYIFYTIEEYEKRMHDETQKGQAKTRMKSFKIDNSKIPFDFRCEIKCKDENGKELPIQKEQFLCYVLDSYFKHKDLLTEYFKKVPR